MAARFSLKSVSVCPALVVHAEAGSSAGTSGDASLGLEALPDDWLRIAKSNELGRGGGGKERSDGDVVDKREVCDTWASTSG